jgi:hypothetical protein
MEIIPVRVCLKDRVRLDPIMLRNNAIGSGQAQWQRMTYKVTEVAKHVKIIQAILEHDPVCSEKIMHAKVKATITLTNPYECTTEGDGVHLISNNYS